MISIEMGKILAAREARWKKIRTLLKHEQSPVVTLTLNIPGPCKKPDWASYVMDYAIIHFTEALSEALIPVLRVELIEGDAGYEWYAVIPWEVEQLKKIAIFTEETHPLGRFFDLDVHSSSLKQFSRSDLGYAPRLCLACERPAHECGRSRRHSVDELLQIMEQRFALYQKSNRK